MLVLLLLLVVVVLLVRTLMVLSVMLLRTCRILDVCTTSTAPYTPDTPDSCPPSFPTGATTTARALDPLTRGIAVVTARRHVSHRALLLPGPRLGRIGLDASRHRHISSTFLAAVVITARAAAASAAAWPRRSGAVDDAFARTDAARDATVLVGIASVLRGRSLWGPGQAGVSFENLLRRHLGVGREQGAVAEEVLQVLGYLIIRSTCSSVYL